MIFKITDYVLSTQNNNIMVNNVSKICVWGKYSTHTAKITKEEETYNVIIAKIPCV